MSFSGSALSYIGYLDSLDSIGSDAYTITIPRNESLSSWYLVDLLCLPIYYKNVKCIIDNEKIEKIIGANKDISRHFLVNDHPFLTIMDDRFTKDEIDVWSQGMSALFIVCLRNSILNFFVDCKMPIYPMPYKSGFRLPLAAFESYSDPVERDISVFFSGRHSVRPSRRTFGKTIAATIPDSVIHFLSQGIEPFTGNQYISYLKRSKIAWCPRSIWAPPDRDCNSVSGKEVEAMRCGAMILKQPIGTQEVAERTCGIHFVEYKNDSSDLIEKIEYYLEHDEERESIALNGKQLWEKHYSLLARANFYIQSCLKAIGEMDVHV